LAAVIGIVPVITPVDPFSDKPDGNVPAATAKVSGAIPPEVDTPDVTAPTVIPLRLVETIATAAALFVATVPTKDLVCDCEEASVTVTLKL
jgi:hypothetical protein